MNVMTYERLVQELCRHVGIDQWHQVVLTQSLEVESHTVTLAYDEDLAPTTISLYLDLGPANDDITASCLLAENAVSVADADGRGYFALIADHNTIAYRDLFFMEDPRVTGEHLADAVSTFVKVGQERLRQARQG